MSKSEGIQYSTCSVDQPRHPGKGAASALPTGTLLAPPLPTGNFAGTFIIVDLAGASGLLVVVVLGGFVGGAPNMGGEPLRAGLSRFSFSPAPIILGLPIRVGTAGSSLTLLLSFDDRFFISALSTFAFFTCAAFLSVLFSLSGLSSSSCASVAPATAGAGYPVGVVSSPFAPNLGNGSDSGLSGDSPSMRMRLSGLGFTGE